MDSLAVTFAPFILVFAVFLLALAVLWTILPFAIFGTKPLLRDLLHELRAANAHNVEIKRLLSGVATSSRPPETPPRF